MLWSAAQAVSFSILFRAISDGRRRSVEDGGIPGGRGGGSRPATPSLAGALDTDRPLARRPSDRLRQEDAGGPLPAEGRVLPGHVRPGGDGLLGRRRARPARLRLYVEAVVHAGHPGAVQRRRPSRPPPLLLPPP